MTGAESDPELFARTELRPTLLRWLSDAVDAVDRWPAGELATLSDDEAISRLVDAFSMRVPVLDRDGMEFVGQEQRTEPDPVLRTQLVW